MSTQTNTNVHTHNHDLMSAGTAFAIQFPAKYALAADPFLTHTHTHTHTQL
jgi:hypothetical protein